MSLQLKLTSVGPPLPSTKRGYHVQLDVHKDGDTIAYGNKNFVITRSLTPGGKAAVYTEHRSAVMVARFNHSGYYVASGDERGNVRVWSYTHAENLLKKAVQPLGQITDLCWDGVSKKIAVSGSGETKAAAFTWDTGADLGKLIGMSTTALTVGFKPTRPYRLAVGTEKGQMALYQIAPTKMLSVTKSHNNLLNCIRYAKDGSKFASCSTDKTINIYDGKTGGKLLSCKSGKKSRHNGSIYGIAWNEDATQLFTASSDKTCKLWDAETGKRVLTINASGTAKPQIRNQQLGCVYTKHGPVSVALSGELTVYDLDKADAPIKAVIVGHQEPLSALAYDMESDTLATGCRGGVVCIWKGGVARRFSGTVDARDSTKIHKAGVMGLSITKSSVFTLGGDGLRTVLDIASGKMDASESVGSSGLHLASARGKSGTFVYCTTKKHLQLVVGGKVTGTTELSALPTAVAISDDGTEIIACTDDKSVHFYSASLELKKTIKFERNTCAAAFSPDKSTYALAQSGNYAITLYKSDGSSVVTGYWAHTGKITKMAFSSDGKYLVSVAMDGNISFWMPSEETFRVDTAAHYLGVIDFVFTKSGLATIGADNCVKTWELGTADAADEA